MTTLTTRKTIMRLAVASACSWIAISAAHAQQADQAAQAEPAAPAAPAAATEPEAKIDNVVTVSGSRISARSASR